MRAATLLYHDVFVGTDHTWSGFPDADAAPYKLPYDAFARHMESLRGAGLRPVRADGLPETGGLPLLLTFDDGGRSAISPVAELLDDFDWNAHFFITGDRIGTRGFLDAAGIRALDGANHVVGAHSWSHPSRFSELPWRRLKEEWQRSTDALSSILGRQVWAASVPGGAYSRAVAEAAWEAGITVLFTSEPEVRVQNSGRGMVIGRFCVRDTTAPREVVRLAEGDPLVRLRHYAAWNVRKLAKSLGGRIYDGYRQRRLNRRYGG